MLEKRLYNTFALRSVGYYSQTIKVEEINLAKAIVPTYSNFDQTLNLLTTFEFLRCFKDT